MAIKVFDLAPLGGDLVIQEKELRLLASLNHPGIVSLLDAGVDTSEPGNPRAFLVMELASGASLRDALATAAPTAEQVAILGRDLADALQYIHQRGIVHRDISPANILLTEYREGGGWHAKFGDFGIALQSDEVGAIEGDTSGTAAYVSPEQVRGSGIGPASDIYSLGLVVLECFTRRLAFPPVDGTSADLRLTVNPVVPSELPFEWQSLLIAMTSRAPVARPDAQQVSDAMGRIMEQRTGRHQLS